MKRINEVIRRLEQGYTEALLCRAEDDVRYVVKSRRAGREALIKEWICGRIAQILGLPIPPFSLLYFPQNEWRFSVYQEDAEALADCPGFGSQFVEPVGELTVTGVEDVPVALRLKVLLFDLLIVNSDRSDNNPNLLWSAHQRELHVIDHNLALGPESTADILANHIFRRDAALLSVDIFRKTMQPELNAVIAGISGIWSELPDEWLEGCSFGLPDVDMIMGRCQTDSFWRAGMA